MPETVKCLCCHKRFPNNPNKHKYRQKLCPYCRTPYTHANQWSLSLRLPKIHIDLQKLFNFFPKLDRRNIYYQCPNPDCKFRTDIPEEVRFDKFPDKTKEVMIDGKMQTIPLTFREIVTCPKCDTHMTRKRGYKQ